MQPLVLLARGLKLSPLQMMAAFAETGQIGRAAERLGIAQPAASRLLSEVEEILGQPVRARAGRGVVLTEAGRVLAERAGRVMQELAEAGREVAEIAAGGVGRVRIGSVTAPARQIDRQNTVDPAGTAGQHDNAVRQIDRFLNIVRHV